MSESAIGNSVSGELLRGYVDRLEMLKDGKAAITDDEKVVFAEAKSSGFTPKYIRAILRLRKLTPSEREEDDAMMDLYVSALGMTRETPLFRHVTGMGIDVAVRDSVIEALKLIAPQDGEITIKVGGGPRLRIWRDSDGVMVEEVPDFPPPPKEPGEAAPSARAVIPDCTPDEAIEMGRQARRDDRAVIANPFPWDDQRRRLWDEGWRTEDGGDGMGPK